MGDVAAECLYNSRFIDCDQMIVAAPSHDLSRALAYVLIGVVLVALMDAVGKILTSSLPMAQIVWARFFFHSIWMAPAILWVAIGQNSAGLGKITAKDTLGHFIRGLLIALSTLFYFISIRDNAIPDAITLFFIEPFLVMILAAIFIGEKLHRRRIVCCVFGFIGVIIVLRPGSGEYTATILLAPLAGLCFAGYIVSARFAGFTTTALVTAWATALSGMIICFPFALYYWQQPTSLHWQQMVLLGFLAATGHYCLTRACQFAHASIVATFHYVEIIAATIISYILFNYIPDLWVWIGFALIAGSKITLTLLEFRSNKI